MAYEKRIITLSENEINRYKIHGVARLNACDLNNLPMGEFNIDLTPLNGAARPGYVAIRFTPMAPCFIFYSEKVQKPKNAKSLPEGISQLEVKLSHSHPKCSYDCVHLPQLNLIL